VGFQKDCSAVHTAGLLSCLFLFPLSVPHFWPSCCQVKESDDLIEPSGHTTKKKHSKHPAHSSHSSPSSSANSSSSSSSSSSSLDQKSSSSTPPATIHDAVLQANSSAVSSFLSKGVSVEERDQYGFTPLMLAVYAGDAQVLVPFTLCCLLFLIMFSSFFFFSTIRRFPFSFVLVPTSMQSMNSR
jgi:hypothetical protein